MEGVIGYTTLFAGNFAPRGWALCQGQILAISQNTALFSILGTTYGGNGTTTFALPDLRGRAVRGAGQGPGLSPVDLGEVNGTEVTTLTSLTMAAHAHTTSVTITPAASTSASTTSPVNGVYATNSELLFNGSADSNLRPYQATLTVSPPAGASSQPFLIVNPILTLNYLICMQGVFPARN